MTEIESMENDSRIYEAGYIFVPTLSEDSARDEAGKLQDYIEGKLQGSAISSELPRLIPLAYPMAKMNGEVKQHAQGYFGWMKFEIEPSKTGELEVKLSKDSAILRFIVLKTVRENTLSSPRRFTPRPEGRKRVAGEGTGMTEEELDKTISELVVE